MRPCHRAVLIVLTLLSPRLVAAQALWVTPVTGKADLDVEWTRPTFDNITGLSEFRGVWVASARARLGEKGALIVAVPRFVGSEDDGFGNPYFGAQFYRPDGTSAFTLGLRVPTISTAGTSGRGVAFRGDFDRYEEAVADYVAFQAEGQGRAWHDSAGADVTVRGGFTLLHPTDRTFGAENEFLFDYGVRFGHRWTRLEATAALSGRFFMTGCCGSFTQRNADQATFEFTWHAPITPRVGLRLPLTETPKNLYKSAVILGVSVPIE